MSLVLFALAGSANAEPTTALNFDAAISPSIQSTLTSEQKEVIDKLVKVHNQVADQNRQKIDGLYQKISACFLDPEAKREQIFSIQGEIDSLQNEIDISAAKTAINVRKMLNDRQRTVFVYGDPLDNYPGVNLTTDEWSSYLTLMKEFLNKRNGLQRKLEDLQFDLTLLYQSTDLNETLLLEKQAQINAAKAELENEKIRLAVRTRGLLTPEQRKIVFNRHHPKIWQDTGINPKQDSMIMGVHMKIEAADQTGRRTLLGLQNDLAKIYLDPIPDENVALEKVREITQARSETARKQLGLILEGRGMLTPEQKKRLIGLMKVPYAPMPGSHLESITKINAIVSSQIGEFLTDFATVRYLPNSKIEVSEPGTVILRSGKALISTSKSARVKCGGYSVAVEPNTIALITCDAAGTTVQNLYDSKAHSLKISSGANTVELLPGSEVIVSDTEDNLKILMAKQAVGRRRPAATRLGNSFLVHSDISLLTVLQKDDLMHLVMMRLNEGDKTILNRTMNMAAAIMQSTQGRGQYSQQVPPVK